MLEMLANQIDNCLSDAYMKKKNIHKLMLVGGMGHSILVQEALRKHFEGFEVEMDFEAGTEGCESLIANGAAAIA